MATEIAPVRASSDVMLEADFKAQKAHEKRLGGFSWSLVADEYGYSSPAEASASVRAYLQRASMRVSERTRKESLDRELERLDTLQSACWDLALSGDLKAIETSLRVINMRAKLLGLEQLTVGQVTNQTILIRGTKDEFIDGLKSVTKGE